MDFRLLVRGDRACFKRPEFVEDLISYDVISPLAARGIFDRIYAAPGMGWRIDEIRVLRPIRSTWMFLAEVEAGDPAAALPVRLSGPAERHMANVLSDVAYLLTGRLEGSATDEHEARFRDRIGAARFARPPFLGVPGFPADVTLLDPAAVSPQSGLVGSGMIDLGWMMFDTDPQTRTGPRFFRATMTDGVIDLRRRDALILAG